VFENRILRRMFGPKREEVAGGWRRLHNEELCNLYATPDIIWMIRARRMGWVGQVTCMAEMRNTYKILVRNLEGKRQCQINEPLLKTFEPVADFHEIWNVCPCL
jgi:hypothetical protein